MLLIVTPGTRYLALTCTPAVCSTVQVKGRPAVSAHTVHTWYDACHLLSPVSKGIFCCLSQFRHIPGAGFVREISNDDLKKLTIKSNHPVLVSILMNVRFTSQHRSSGLDCCNGPPPQLNPWGVHRRVCRTQPRRSHHCCVMIK